ncbi:hypothetical protein SAMN05216525_1776 [Bradyrhizobium sp. Gha]|nr:hypothetical protein SAMN05216525_1776 [Bradyrhizobium sp. Gha]
MTPHIPIDGHLSKTGTPRKTAVDARTTRRAGYEISQRCRNGIEEVFGWIKSSAGLAKGEATRARARGRRLYVGARGLQSDPSAQAAGGAAMKRAGQMACRGNARARHGWGELLHPVRSQRLRVRHGLPHGGDIWPLRRRWRGIHVRRQRRDGARKRPWLGRRARRWFARRRDMPRRRRRHSRHRAPIGYFFNSLFAECSGQGHRCCCERLLPTPQARQFHTLTAY